MAEEEKLKADSQKLYSEEIDENGEISSMSDVPKAFVYHVKRTPKLIKENLAIFVLIIAIVALLFWYFGIRGQLGILVVEVREMDEDKAIEAATVAIYRQDGSLAVKDRLATDSSGIANFVDVPANEELLIKVDPPLEKFKAGSFSVMLKPGERKRLTGERALKIEREKKLAILTRDISVNLAPSCSVKTNVEVRNEGTIRDDAELMADGDIAKILRFENPFQRIGPGAVASYSVVASAPQERGFKSVQGNLRIRHTGKKIGFEIKEAERPRMQIDIIRTDVLDFRGRAGTSKKTQVAIRNLDRNTANIADISLAAMGDFAGWVSFELQQINETNSKGGIRPEEEAFFGLTVAIPTGTPAGEYTGRLLIKTSCETKTFPLSAKVE